MTDKAHISDGVSGRGTKPAGAGKGQFGLTAAMTLIVGSIIGVGIGSVQVVTTVVKFAAQASMSTVGLFYIKSANFMPWNASKESTISAIGGGMAAGDR